MNVSRLNNHHIEQSRTGTNFSPGNITLIQAILYTHNKFWNHKQPYFLYGITFKKGLKR